MKRNQSRSFNWKAVTKFLIKEPQSHKPSHAKAEKLSFGCLESALLHTENVGSLSNSGETKSRAVYHDSLVEGEKKKDKTTCLHPWHLSKAYTQAGK